jgi:hypothetical protein
MNGETLFIYSSQTPNKSTAEIPAMLNDTFGACQVTAGGRICLLSTYLY